MNVKRLAIMPVVKPPTAATDLPKAFERYRPAIQSAVSDHLNRYESPMHATHRYFMGWEDESGMPVSGATGKWLRPTLTLLAAEASGGNLARALPIAIALEFVHSFSLIHDDLEDRDEYRHHRPTVWKVWGDATAIISGNAMLKVADASATASAEAGVSLEISLGLQRELVGAYLTMMEGQFLDLKFESERDVTIDQYFDMIARKTGALITAAVVLGVGTSENSRTGSDMNSVAGLGAELGRLFQVRDDALGIWGGLSTGKPVGTDIARRKKSLPAIHALNNASGPAKSLLDDIYQSSDSQAQAEPSNLDESQILDVLEIMESVNTRLYCQSVCERHWSRAESILATIDMPTRYRQDFEEIGSFLINRES